MMMVKGWECRKGGWGGHWCDTRPICVVEEGEKEVKPYISVIHSAHIVVVYQTSISL